MKTQLFLLALIFTLLSVGCGGMMGSRSGGADADADGVANDVDACPHSPEDTDDFEDRDGCPDPDNDRDGILDADDQCPNQPEDKDGDEDTDGCPD